MQRERRIRTGTRHRDRPTRVIGVARALTSAIALGLQIAGLYAAFATFGAWITVGLYAVGGLATFLQYLVLRRATT